MSYLLLSNRRITFLAWFIVSLLMFVSVSITNAGGAGGSGGSGSSRVNEGRYNVNQGNTTASRSAANTMARDFNANPSQMCSGCRASVSSNRDGTMNVDISRVDRGGNDGNRSTTGSTVNPGPINCTAQPNLRTIDIFFVPAGSQPNSQSSVTNRPGAAASSRSIINSPIPANPFQNSMVRANELEVGVLYDPIAMIRNTAPCTAASGASSINSRASLPSSGTNLSSSPVRLFNFISSLLFTPVYAGGRGSSAPQPARASYFTNQLPFGSNGSFPIRARIDVGNNGSFEWEHYINAFGPLDNSRTTYLRLPVFSTGEVGSHTIEVVTDIRHSVDPGRACNTPANPASAGWGCVRETSETDNDRSEAFTTRVGNASYRLAVDVSDVTVRAGSVLTEVPFVGINAGLATINDYRYRVTINGIQFASTTRTTTLAPSARETVRATGSFTVPNTRTSLPLIVCAQVATSTQVCDTARLIVTTPQCSDTQDNEPDGTQDANDPGCYDDPLDPTTYDPNDDNEGDMATTSPSVTIEFKPVVNPVRYNTGAALEYVINGPAPMSCVVTGGGTNSPITHTPPRTTGQVTTTPVTSTQLYTLRCTANVGGGTLQFERTTTVDVLPQIQET